MKPYRDILKLVWPLALGMVNNAVMQFVDRVYLARESMQSLEAVLPATTLAWIFLGFFQSVVGYSGVFAAQYHGAGDERECARCCKAGGWLALLSGVMILPLVLLGDAVFSLTAATPELVAMEASYYDIVVVGGVFLFGQMAYLSYFTGRGRTRIVFWVNLLGNLFNIALDPLLIFGCWGFPRLGIAGAAYATVASQAVQFAILAVAANREIRRLAEPPRHFAAETFRLVGRILRYGIPSGGYEILNMASFTIFVFVTGRTGDVSFAASNACFTVNYLLFAPMLGFSIGAQTLVGQARGRGDDRGAVIALRRTLVLGLSFVFVCCLLVLVLNRPILALFAPDGASHGEFVSLAFRLMLLMSAWLLFDATDIIISGALKGAGDTRFVFLLMLVSSFVVWLPLVFAVLSMGGSIVALWSTMIVYVLVITAGSFIRWRGGRWRRFNLVLKEAVR